MATWQHGNEAMWQLDNEAMWQHGNLLCHPLDLYLVMYSGVTTAACNRCVSSYVSVHVLLVAYLAKMRFVWFTLSYLHLQDLRVSNHAGVFTQNLPWA